MTETDTSKVVPAAAGSPHAAPTTEIKLWLDDVRPAPPGWLHVKSAAAALAYLNSGLVTHASLDHDLGDKRMDGTWLVRAMVRLGAWPTKSCLVHSANPAGGARMRDIIDREGPYD